MQTFYLLNNLKKLTRFLSMTIKQKLNDRMVFIQFIELLYIQHEHSTNIKFTFVVLFLVE